MDVNITPEEEDFFVKYGQADGEPKNTSECDEARFLGIAKRVRLLVQQTVQKYHSVSGGAIHLPPLEVSLTQQQMEFMRAKEMAVRQLLDRLGLLLRLGLGDDFEEMAEDAWSTLACLITVQKKNCEAQAQNIYIEQLAKSLARHGPYHRHSISALINIASTFSAQGLYITGAQILAMAYILLKHDRMKHGSGWTEEPAEPVLDRLRDELINIFTDKVHSYGDAEPYVRDELKAREAAAQELGGWDAESQKGVRRAHLRLSKCLLAQRKFLEAETIAERAMCQSLEQVGISSVDETQEDLQGMKIKDLITKMRRLRIAIPHGLEKPDLVQLYVEGKGKVLAGSSETFELMSAYARSLLSQKDAFPERLPLATSLHRQVLDVKMKHPEYGPTDGGTLQTMNDLKDSLSYQHKYVEALAIGEKALATRKRLYRDASHPAFQANLRRQREDLQLQKRFRAEAESILGPMSSWPGDEDGVPASVMFEKTVKEACQRRSKASSSRSSSSSTTSKAEPDYFPVEFDPTDVADVNYGALMAGMGVAGLKWVKLKAKGQSVIKFDFTAGRPPNMECIKCWATVVKLVEASMGSSLPSGPPDSPGGRKKIALTAAYLESLDMQEQYRKEVEQALKRASESQDVMKQKEEAGRQGENKGGLGPYSKPIKICCGCGSYAAKKRCGKCLQVYACSEACFNAAWEAHHKHTCKRQVKK